MISIIEAPEGRCLPHTAGAGLALSPQRAKKTHEKIGSERISDMARATW